MRKRESYRQAENMFIGGVVSSADKKPNIRSGTPYKKIERKATIVDRLKVKEMIGHYTKGEIAKQLGLTVNQVRELLSA